ncbi:MAG TPA: hypothetical protein VND94_10765 [Terriglobia bacterium]|nr:hypothetical protein [Terriglobia bacterium]
MRFGTMPKSVMACEADSMETAFTNHLQRAINVFCGSSDLSADCRSAKGTD